MDGQKGENNPWLGLKMYEEGQTIYGRTDDINALAQNILFNVQTVIYGKSGIGKSSILHAGIYPILRQNGLFPVDIRLVHNQPKRSYNSQIWERVVDSLGHLCKERLTSEGFKETVRDIKGRCEELAPKSEKESLWEMFHRNAFYDADGQRIKPVLVFDQFEEIFTREQDKGKMLDFFDELAGLINNVPPEHMFCVNAEKRECSDEEKFVADDGLLDVGYDTTISNYIKESNFHVILCLREDFLFHLERNIANIPLLKHNRYCLKPLNGEQAASVIMEPSPGLVAGDVAKEIISKITGVPVVDVDLDNGANLEVDSAILSLFLSELYKRKPIGSKSIDRSLVFELGDNIIQDFYEQTMSSISQDFVKVLEDTLITQDGRRDNAFVSNIVGEPEDPIRVRELNLLKEQRLIHEFPWNKEGLRVEFMHDVLCDTIVRRKKEREQSREKAEEEKLRKRKYRNNLMSLAVAFLFITILLLVRSNAAEREFNSSLQKQMAITQRKNDSLLALIKQNDEQKDFMETYFKDITLKLNFYVGRSDFVKDSTTLAELDKLIQQVKGLDGRIVSIVFETWATPEGSLQTNMNLARARANAFKEYLRPHLGDIPISVSGQVHSWLNVAIFSYENGCIEESNAIVEAIAKAEGEPTKVGYMVQNSSAYLNIKTQILPQLRYAKCRFELR